MKKIFNFLFTISILFFIVITTIRFNVVEKFLNSFIKEKISSYFITEIRENLIDFDDETKSLIINGLIESEEFDAISNKIYNNVIKDLIENKSSELDISNELNSLIDKKSGNLPSFYKMFIKSVINEIDFNKIYSNILFGIKNKLNKETIDVLKIYYVCTSDSIIALIGTIIILSLFMIIIKNKSINDSLNDIGMSLLISGGIMMILLFFLNKLEVGLSMLGYTEIDLSLFIFLTFAFLIVGFILKDLKIKKRN